MVPKEKNSEPDKEKAVHGTLFFNPKTL